MDEAKRIFWDEERAKERHFVSTSPERVKLMTTALEESRIESFYNALEQCVRTYILHTPDSLSCQKDVSESSVIMNLKKYGDAIKTPILLTGSIP